MQSVAAKPLSGVVRGATGVLTRMAGWLGYQASKVIAMMEYVAILALFIGTSFLSRGYLASRREKFILSYPFPATIRKKVKERYPHLTDKHVSKVIEGLREYFVICNSARRRLVSMPSQVVDVAWHEFILFTRDYKQFCDKGLGRFLHHTPAQAMKTPTIAQDGIKRAWRLACRREKIDPKSATRLPLLFALDSELNIPDGFKYSLHCTGKGDDYCAGHIGCGGGCSGGGGGDSDGGGGDSGCGGGGCGGD